MCQEFTALEAVYLFIHALIFSEYVYGITGGTLDLYALVLVRDNERVIGFGIQTDVKERLAASFADNVSLVL